MSPFIIVIYIYTYIYLLASTPRFDHVFFISIMNILEYYSSFSVINAISHWLLSLIIINLFK